MLTKSDISLVLSVIAVIVGCYFLYDLSRGVEKFVVVEIDGRIEKKIDLPKNLIFDVNGVNGPIKIEISGRKVRMLDSSCPNKICVKSGWINKRGESIICLPNRAIVKILGEEEELDGTTR
ncbi:MAG: NusG domain II-containing protein [bacterium]|nr:NusG domain II-containing protein [bacterium]